MKNIPFVAASLTVSACCRGGDVTSASSFANAFILPVGGSHPRRPSRRRHHARLLPRPRSSSSARFLSVAGIFFPKWKRRMDDEAASNDGNVYIDTAESRNEDDDDGGLKSALLRLLAKVTPNESTPDELTRDILRAASALEGGCPTPEADVLPRLAGNWELLWTAQDLTSTPNGGRRSGNPFANFINPLENQSYSNNSRGRSNPILPQNLQDGLEDIGLLVSKGRRDGDGEDRRNNIRSTQFIDLRRNRIRNVVAFEVNNPTPLFSRDGRTGGFVTVDVGGAPDPADARRINVKFDACRLTITGSPVDVTFPLGAVGPTGWLRTAYVDDDIRITRGHKGSVFILCRTARNR